MKNINPKVAIIGGGGREHSLWWKWASELGEQNVYCLPGNGGIPNSHPVNVSDFEKIKDFCLNHHINLIFVGPEQPLSAGIVDYFKGSSIQIIGPSKEGAKLESSKILAKEFMKKYGVSTAGFQAFHRPEEAFELIKEKKGKVVIKYDGLAGGKGVFVCDSEEEAYQALESLQQKYGETFLFLIEEKLKGDELSVIAFTDGNAMKLLTYSQDHKQLYEGDKGPNTGGMGAYTPVKIKPELDEKIKKKIVEPTLAGIRTEKMNYKGVLYFGIMISDGEPFLLEYNVRFGDPETQVLLPALKTSLWEISKAVLNESLKEMDFEFENDYLVDVVLASEGYPGKYETGFEIKGLENIPADVLVFHAGTRKEGNKYFTSGGRVLNVVGRGKTLEEARTKVYAAIEKISFPGMYFRKDIGLRENKELSG